MTQLTSIINLQGSIKVAGSPPIATHPGTEPVEVCDNCAGFACFKPS